jgi:RNA polymerase sigma-70 factor (ECF subfamily)
MSEQQTTLFVPAEPAARDSARGRLDGSVIAGLRADGSARRSAITQLYDRYGREFKRFFRRHGATESEAEDLLQETFVKVLRSIETWSGEGTLEAWLWAVARNTLLSERRGAAATRSTIALDAQDTEAAEQLVMQHGGASGDPADADCVKRGLYAFSEKHAEYAHVIERIVLDGWSYEELAVYRNCAPGAAREYLSQCRKRVWHYIGHCFRVGAE